MEGERKVCIKMCVHARMHTRTLLTDKHTQRYVCVYNDTMRHASTHAHTKTNDFQKAKRSRCVSACCEITCRGYLL